MGKKEKSGEENISAQEHCKETSAWISSAHEYKSRSFDIETTTCKRAKAFDRLNKVYVHLVS